MQPYCSGHCLFVSRYVQLIGLVRLLNMVLYVILMMTEVEESLCVREDGDYKTQWYTYEAIQKDYRGVPNHIAVRRAGKTHKVITIT